MKNELIWFDQYQINNLHMYVKVLIQMENYNFFGKKYIYYSSYIQLCKKLNQFN